MKSKTSKKKVPTGDFTIQKFDDMKTSTMSFMVYHNLEFKNFAKAFEMIKTTEIEVFYTKKHKKVDKSRIRAPKGAIYGLSIGDYIRGVNIRKGELHWCPKCQLRDDKGKKVKTVHEVIISTDNPEVRKLGWFLCKICDVKFDGKEITEKKIHHFLNQLSFGISVGDRNVHVMMFKTSIKIAGCRSKNDAKYVVKKLFKELISTNKQSTKYKTLNTYDMKENEEIRILKEKGDSKSELKIDKLRKSILPIFVYNDPEKELKFQFDCTMMNKGFWFNIFMDQEMLNIVMNEPKYMENVIMSTYETTNQVYVSIKMKQYIPSDLSYDMLSYIRNARKFVSSTVNELTLKKKKKTKKDPSVTFIVFNSSQTILTGKCEKNIRDMYNFYTKVISENLDAIQICGEVLPM